MSQTKRFYWVKTAIDFFNDDLIDCLLSKKYGSEYVIIYQMLILLSANTGGYLATKINGNMVPMDISKIARETKHFNEQFIVETLKQLKELGLMANTPDNGLYYIVNIEKMIGSETNYAIEKRKYRAKKEEKKKERNKTRLTKKQAEELAKNIEIAKIPWMDKIK